LDWYTPAEDQNARFTGHNLQHQLSLGAPENITGHHAYHYSKKGIHSNLCKCY
jgi:hypothetical protein